jgi:thioredoxin reductase
MIVGRVKGMEGKERKYDVVIMGGGLAGLTCGLYLQEAGLNVLILERSPRAGGLTSSWQVHEQENRKGRSSSANTCRRKISVFSTPCTWCSSRNIQT